MTPKDRKSIFDKYGGKCAYCGKEINKKFHVDHIEPIYRNDNDEQFERRATHGDKRTDLKRGVDSIENWNPACPRCNNWKGTMSLETFRSEIAEQVRRARSYSCNFRMAEDFGLIEETGIGVEFYFETFK